MSYINGNMTHAFTITGSYQKVMYTLLYGAYFQPETPPPNSYEDYASVVDYLPYIAYPYEVVSACRHMN